MIHVSPEALSRLAAAQRPKDTTAATSASGWTYDAQEMLDANDADLSALGISTGKHKPHAAGGQVWELSACAYSNAHEDGAFRLQYPDGGLHIGCHHDRCQGRTIKGAPDLFPQTLAVKGTPPVARGGVTFGGKPPNSGGDEVFGGAPPGAVVIGLDSVAPEPVSWLWPGWLARGKLHILGGHAGDGKSTLTLALGSTLTRGGVMPDGQRSPRTNVLLVLGEDDLADSVRPRIDLHGGDPARFFTVVMVQERGRDRAVSLQEHAEALRAAILKHDIGLVILDPLTGFMPKTDRNAEGSVRDGLMAFTRVLQDTRCAALGVMHVGKTSGDGRRPLQMLLGSTGFGAIARVVWLTGPVPGDQNSGNERRLLGVTKSNVAMKPKPLEWSRPLDQPVQWHGVSQHSVDDAFASRPRDARRQDAKSWLAEYLAGGSKSTRAVERAAAAAGITPATLRRAREELGVESVRPEHMGAYFWKLPAGDPWLFNSTLPSEQPRDHGNTDSLNPLVVQQPEVNNQAELQGNSVVAQLNGSEQPKDAETLGCSTQVGWASEQPRDDRDTASAAEGEPPQRISPYDRTHEEEVE